VDIAVKWVLERGVDPGDAGYVKAFFPGLQLAPGQMAVDRVVTSRARGRGKKRLISCRYFLTGAGLQVQTHRDNYPCKSSPVGKYLQARCAESRLSALGLCRWNTPSLRKRGDCHEDGLLNSLERLMKIRPREKAEKKKGWKSRGATFCSAPSS